MAGPLVESLDEVHILIDAFLSLSGKVISNSNHVQPPVLSKSSTSTQPEKAHITTPAFHVDVRQNNPQDCQNLIIASVDRATVEISRTIIALNATFSQQLQQASISASNGIKSAQNSASSSIGIVVKSADIATSSASFSLTIANKAVVSATSALADFSLSSSSEVASLSSSLNLLQASLTSLQASASAAISALASVTGSAAAQVASLLASADGKLSPTATQTIVPAGQNLPTFQSSAQIILTPTQIAGIVIGAVISSILLSIAIYFAISKLRRKDRDSYLDEKYNLRSPKELPSHSSSTPRTGNITTIKFSPPKSSNASRQGRSEMQIQEGSSVERLHIPPIEHSDVQPKISGDSSEGLTFSNTPAWPLSVRIVHTQLQKYPTPGDTDWPLPISSLLPVSEALNSYTNQRFTNGLDGYQYEGARKSKIVMDPFSDQSELPDSGQVSTEAHDTSFENSAHVLLSTKSHVVEQGFDFGNPKDSFNDINLVREHENPFHDTPEDISHESWDGHIYPLGGKYITKASAISEDSGPATVQGQQHRVLEKSVKETMSQSEQARSSFQQVDFQSHIPTPLEIFSGAEYPRRRILPENTMVKLGVGNEKIPTADEPSFLLNYNPPMPEAEKIPVPPQRRSPSVGSVRPLRRMLPPRQTTVSPPRQRKKSEEVDNPAPSPPRGTFLLASSAAAKELQQISSLDSTSAELKERSNSPLRRNPVVVDVDIVSEAHLYSDMSMQAENDTESPLPQQGIRTNQQPPEYISRPAEKKPLSIQDVLQDTGEDDRHFRGRSMIRTSDIIDARLSMKAHMREGKDEKSALQSHLSVISLETENLATTNTSEEATVRTKNVEVDSMRSPLQRHPVDLSLIPNFHSLDLIARSNTLPPQRRIPMERNAMKRRSRTLPPIRPVNKLLELSQANMTREDSPLRRNPSDTFMTSFHRRSRPISPPRSLNTFLLSAPPPMSREDSPLRRNPSRPNKSPIPPHVISSTPFERTAKIPKVASNGLFAQSLSKFQNLASQNPQDSILASTEVTQRAIAGIYIPGSLREQAVRTVSRSRERR